VVAVSLKKKKTIHGSLEMVLKFGLYLIFFPQYIHDEDPDNDYDDDGTCIKYSRGLGTAIYIGDIPQQFFWLYYENLREKFHEAYGEVTERPARMELYPHVNDEPSEYSPGTVATEQELMHMLQNYKNVSPGQREMQNIALDVKKEIMQFIAESDKQATDPTLQRKEKPKQIRRRVAEFQLQEAARMVADGGVTRQSAEKAYNLPQGALSKGKGAALVEEYIKTFQRNRKISEDEGNDLLYNEFRRPTRTRKQ
jgi:hypothetical protein